MRVWSGPRKRCVKGRELPHWQLRERDLETGRVIWRSTHQKDYRAAKAYKQKLEIDEVTHPLVKARRNPIGFSEAVDRWYTESLTHLRPGSIPSRLAHVKRWKIHFSGALLYQVGREAIKNYLALRALTCKGRTLNLERAMLSMFFRWAENSELVERNPVTGISGYPVLQRRPRILLPDEQMTLLSSITTRHLQTLVLLALETGLRRRTLLGLEWSHVDLSGGWLNIPSDLTKSGRQLHLPLSQAAAEVLRTWRSESLRVDGKVFHGSAGSLDEQFRYAVKRAGIPDLHFHDLRRTCFSRLRQRGVSLELAMELTDHKDIRTALKAYRGITDSELVEIVRPKESIRSKS